MQYGYGTWSFTVSEEHTLCEDFVLLRYEAGSLENFSRNSRILKALCCSETSVIHCPVRQRLFPEERTPQLHRCENLKTNIHRVSEDGILKGLFGFSQQKRHKLEKITQ